MIRIELPKEEVRAGERLTGQAVWNSDGGKTPRKIEVVCQWRIDRKGKDYVEVVGNAVEFELSARSQATVPLDFGIPTLGPLTYDGKLFRIVWEIVARVDLPFARDEVETRTFVVKPSVWDADSFAADEGDEDFDEEFLDEEP